MLEYQNKIQQSKDEKSQLQMRRGILSGFNLSLNTSINQFCVIHSLPIFPKETIFAIVEGFEPLLEKADNSIDFITQVYGKVDLTVIQPLLKGSVLFNKNIDEIRTKQDVIDFSIQYIMNPDVLMLLYETYQLKRKEVLFINEQQQRITYTDTVSFEVKEKISHIIK